MARNCCSLTRPGGTGPGVRRCCSLHVISCFPCFGWSAGWAMISSGAAIRCVSPTRLSGVMLSNGKSRARCLALAAAVVISTTAGNAFDLQGHRGARGLAPENTLAGFAKALSIGVSTLELDLAMTKDGILVV